MLNRILTQMPETIIFITVNLVLVFFIECIAFFWLGFSIKITMNKNILNENNKANFIYNCLCVYLGKTRIQLAGIIGIIKLQMNPEQCREHTLNTSGSKFAYKFGKSNRFKTPRLHTDTMYDIDHKNMTKACGFGYGERSSIAKKTITPSPQNYIMPSTITKKCKTFGSSRDDTKFRSFLMKALRQASNPAPNTYTIPSSIHERRISLRQRLPTEIDLKTAKNIVPPPNAYDLDRSGNPGSGVYYSSKYKNTRRIIFLGRDYPGDKSFDVGPGSYNIQKGRSLDQSHFRSTCRSFGTASRPGPEDRSKKYIPGPGMYETFSQFPTHK